ncbi:Blue copper protein [Striga hermonthica]|uniref:Blue copper protein n=1 Tax=Striga hermonthica TaxID=68872 RepID=A0A9N7MPM8_STRHE|nr:Blue copper protein [Striga hermonthica]
MMKRGAGLMAALFGAVFALILSCAVGQTAHIVGGSVGWTTRIPNATFYSDWASGQTFRVGDTLVFNFMTGLHDVVQVPQASYTACSGNAAIGSPILTGPANVTLNTTGNHYYICTFGSHCQQGQRLSISVRSSTGGGAIPPTAAPPTTSGGAIPPTATSGGANPPGATSPTSPGAGSPPGTQGQPGSGAASWAGSFLFVVLSAGVVLAV